MHLRGGVRQWQVGMIKNFEAEEGASCAVFRRYNKLIVPHVTNLHAIKRRVFVFRKLV
jgi:hypothetical protein